MANLNMAHSRSVIGDAVRLSSRLEKLNRITIRVLQLDLFPARAYFHLVAKMEPGLLQHLNAAGKIRYLKHNTVPSTRFLLTPAVGNPRLQDH
jgi:hypothetical protein